jgi:hypothetical protein
MMPLYGEILAGRSGSLFAMVVMRRLIYPRVVPRRPPRAGCIVDKGRPDHALERVEHLHALPASGARHLHPVREGAQVPDGLLADQRVPKRRHEVADPDLVELVDVRRDRPHLGSRCGERRLESGDLLLQRLEPRDEPGGPEAASRPT